MKQHKYREELQKRTINPSSSSWEKLNEKLDSNELEGKGKKWLFLKIASVVLILVSVGFYFFQPQEEIISTPTIVAPTSKEKFNKIPVKDDVIETEIATIPNTSTNKKKTIINANRNDAKVKEVVFVKAFDESETPTIKNSELVLIDPLTKEIPSAEIVDTEEQLLDDEIEQLLHQSKIKLIFSGEISSKKLVNSNALLNSVEDDLDKSLKQKLLEKIVITINKDKEVVSSKEN